MRINVGYPEFINDETELNKRYETFNVKGTKANALIIFDRESTAKIGLEKLCPWWGGACRLPPKSAGPIFLPRPFLKSA